MQSWTDITFELAQDDKPIVTAHTHTPAVTLHLSGIRAQGQGFALTFTRHHKAVIAALHAAVQALPEPGDDPFADDDCPTCTKTTDQPGFPCQPCRDQFAYDSNH